MYHNSQETMAGRAPVCHSSVKVVSERLSFFTAACLKGESKKEKKVAVLATAEVPAKSVDLTAINLTELVNGMLNTAFKGTKKFFSLLSITSYSSFAFHKVSVLIYNISNLKIVDPSKFPMRYCYCLNNMTNDLTDFTALLVDIIGNSTSYLTEIFKSTSILSVSQSNNSDCIYICVMTGQTGRNLSDFWEMIEKSPVINYTFSSNASADLDIDSILPSLMTLQDTGKTMDEPAEEMWTFKSAQGVEEAGMNFLDQSVIKKSRLWECLVDWATQGAYVEDLTELKLKQRTVWLVLGLAMGYVPSSSASSRPGCPQTLKASPVTSPPVTVLVQKINPCVMELCRFFQQCLCVSQRRYPRQESMRYCIEYYSWFLKNATFICARVKRMAYSNTLKQKCLANICKSI
ncbi:PREDICTED: HERV-H LTR-associating protein 1 [Crocodylus porosus]|uniref:HERV-H LTR-associating protein 1 n=1 Tax=Crocodylus porosus TaxID=8502 RepID=UPI0009401F7B|nr:PREDICTED: HERV-H LTR-associating protein 1 [Crocodylus porosus]